MSIFILCYNITYWILPTARSLQLDYKPGVPHGTAAEVRVPLEETVTFRFFVDHLPSGLSKRMAASASRPPTRPSTPPLPPEMGPLEAQSTSILPSTSAVRKPSSGGEPQRQPTQEDNEKKEEKAEQAVLATNEPPQPVPASDAGLAVDEPPPGKVKRVWRQTKAILAPIKTPVVISMAISIPIALIPPLKALFTHDGETTYHFGSPNGEPPLGWFLGTAEFIGDIAIPLSVIQLGGSFAEIRIVRGVAFLCRTFADSS